MIKVHTKGKRQVSVHDRGTVRYNQAESDSPLGYRGHLKWCTVRGSSQGDEGSITYHPGGDVLYLLNSLTVTREEYMVWLFRGSCE